jgi:putative DNA primase/helicase
VAFDAGNIDPVLKNFTTAFPKKNYIITADNDLYGEKNIGLHKANLAGQKYGAKIISPNFDNLNLLHNDLNLQHLKPTDFNDLHQIAGLSAVRNQIENSIHIVEKHHGIEID